jgi:hypothetical protein
MLRRIGTETTDWSVFAGACVQPVTADRTARAWRLVRPVADVASGQLDNGMLNKPQEWREGHGWWALGAAPDTTRRNCARARVQPQLQWGGNLACPLEAEVSK